MSAGNGFARELEEGFAPGYFPDHLGMQLVACGDGIARVRLPFRGIHRQHQGVIQGGATATLIDVSMAWAVASVVHPDLAPTVDLTINYLRPVVDQDLECVATVVKAGRAVATVRAEVATAQGDLAALGTGTFLVRTAPSRP